MMKLSLATALVAVTSAATFAQSRPAMDLEDVLLTDAYSGPPLPGVVQKFVTLDLSIQ